MAPMSFDTAGSGKMKVPGLKGAAAAAAASYIVPPIDDRYLAGWGDSMTDGAGSTPGNDYLSNIGKDGGWIIYEGGVYGERSGEVLTRVLADTAHVSWTSIFWAGRNDIGTGTSGDVVGNIAQMVAHIGHQRFLVLSVLPRTDEPIGSAGRTQIANINAALAAAWGSRFVDLHPALCTDPGGVIPATLMSDSTHLADPGYAIVKGVVAPRLAALPTSAPDSTPGTFDFPPSTGRALSTLVQSAQAQVTRINVAAAISVTGGEYQVNAGAWTATPGSVVNGDLVRVRHTTSASFSTATSTTLTIGGVSATFEATTAASANLIANGGFDDTSAWILDADWTIAGGKLVATATVANTKAAQALTFVAGGQYEITYTISDRTAGNIRAILWGSTVVNGTTRSVAGTYTETLTANSSTQQLRFISTTSSTLKIDDVVVRRVA